MKVHNSIVRYAHSGKDLVADFLPGVAARHTTLSQPWTSTGPVPPSSLRGVPPEVQHVAHDTQASASFTSDGHPPSEEVKKYVPELPSILSQMSLLDTHPASVIHDALHTPNCVCCGFFGAFVLAPTMERCCFTCLQKNSALWVLPKDEVAGIFGLTERDLRNLPSFNAAFATKARSDATEPDFCNLRKTSMYSVCHATHHAFVRFGTPAMRAKLAHSAVPGRSSKGWDLRQKQLHETQMILGPDQPPTWDVHSPQAPNKYPGVGAIRLPVILRQNGSVSVERGIWCLGCEALCRYWKDLSDDNRARATAESEKWSSKARPVEAVSLYKCEWTKEQFVAHSKRCLGIHILSGGDM